MHAKKFIEAELQKHPRAQLIDIYKLFYQSAFGPGHIISDADSAREYLTEELQDSRRFEAGNYQEITFFNDYYRVNLLLIIKDAISFDDYLAAFLASAKPEKEYSWDEWKIAWQKINLLLQNNGINFENEESDRMEIAKILKNEIRLFSHSKIYRDLYHPHYRLISKAQLENLGVL